MAESKQSLIQTLEQERASEAWNCINRIIVKEVKEKYCGIAKNLPVLILTNGLGQTLAFVKSKGIREEKDKNKPEKVAYTEIYKNLSAWLVDKRKVYNSGQGEIIEKIIKGDSAKYRQATTETLAFLNWLKRFAEAVLPEESAK